MAYTEAWYENERKEIEQSWKNSQAYMEKVATKKPPLGPRANMIKALADMGKPYTPKTNRGVNGVQGEFAGHQAETAEERRKAWREVQ